MAENGKAASHPIPIDLAADLRAYLVDRPVDAPLWPGTWADKAAAMLRKDAATAGIPAVVDGPDGSEVLDFHALRVSYGTILDSLNVSLKERMGLMRHSDPRLTTVRYTRVRPHNLDAVADRLPTFVHPLPSTAEAAEFRATGTDARPRTVRPWPERPKSPATSSARLDKALSASDDVDGPATAGSGRRRGGRSGAPAD